MAAPAAKPFSVISAMLAEDGVRGVVQDSNKQVVLEFPQHELLSSRSFEVTAVRDTGTLDGIVVGVQGADETAHLRLKDSSGVEYNVGIRDMSLAKRLAKEFRGEPVRVQVHGTWSRDGNDKWGPERIYADSYEVLDGTSLPDVTQRLAAVPNNDWTMLRSVGPNCEKRSDRCSR